ncbi:MAG TPA: hypothetical protein VNL74_00980 [Methylococcus sp.]|nr:hypothetical protein [Methylococcus sp.]
MATDRPTIRLNKETLAFVSTRPEGQNVSSYINECIQSARMAADKLGVDISKLPAIAERYAEIVKRHGVVMTEREAFILVSCLMGSFVEPLLIRHLADEVEDSEFADEEAGQTLIAKLRSASFADLVATVEKLRGDS